MHTFYSWAIYLLFLALSPGLYADLKKDIEAADRALALGSPDEAIQLYEKALTDIPQEQAGALRIRLAELYLSRDNPERALVVVGDHHRLLKAQALQKMAHYRQALGCLNSPPYSPEELLMRGQLLARLGRTQEAMVTWSSLQPKTAAYRQAQLEMVRCDPDRQCLLTPEDPYALAYYRAEGYFDRNEYSKAAEAYAQSLPKENAHRAPWYGDAIYKLLLCHIERHAYEQAKQLLNELRESTPLIHLAKACAQEDISVRIKELSRLAAEPGLRERALFHLSMARLEDRSADPEKQASEAALTLLQLLQISQSSQTVEHLMALLPRLSASRQQEVLHQIETLCAPQDVGYARGCIAEQLNDNPCSLWQDVVDEFPLTDSAGSALHRLGRYHYQQGQYTAAETAFQGVIRDYPYSTCVPEALFFAGRTAECMGKDPIAYYKELYTRFPGSAYAAEAYFAAFPYEMYVNGSPNAMRHLQQMKGPFPDSPFTIAALYLLGMEQTKTALTDAIENFQKAEELFDRLAAQCKIEEAQLEFYQALRFKATLERARTNLMLALRSRGAKRDIYLEYCVATLLELCKDLDNVTCNNRDKLLQEARCGLADAYLKMDKLDPAEALLNQTLAEQTHATRGYYVARSYGALATIAMRRGNPQSALEYIKQAELSGHQLLSPDEKLDLWLTASDCYQQLGELDNAMLRLSQVINDDCVSSLRLKAMLLRAQIYEQQGRDELAKKQLLALARQEGEWAEKAKEHLQRNYEYH